MPADTLDGELAMERAAQARAEASLKTMRTEVAGPMDTTADAFVAQALERARLARIEALGREGDSPAFFARIDRDLQDNAALGVETFRLGRRHIRDAKGDAVVIDWRVPVARAFYQARPSDPMGVHLRRRFGFDGGQLTSFEDEQLDNGETLGLASQILRREIERPRVGPMRDIVATIQPEQDDLVRADLDQSLCVQGSPGTGKTAVGLHRAAYLLYTFPDRLRRSGVLVVGPNDAFLHYTSLVLPTLGEAGIAQTTVDELVGADEETPLDPAELAVLKGDARMAEVIGRALASYQSEPDAEGLLVTLGSRRYRLSPRSVAKLVDEVRSTGARWPAARERLRNRLAGAIRLQIELAGGGLADSKVTALARSSPVKQLTEQVFPPVVAAALLARLFSDPDFLGACSADLLTDDERTLLLSAGVPKNHRKAVWTVADRVLLDEIGGVLEDVGTWLHLVVDEAQDLSAMQLRALARRCPIGSVTVLGDLAQATTPWACGSWAETLGHLGHGDAELLPLTAGFRVPGEILELANALLPHIAPDVPPATSVRQAAGCLSFSAFSGGSALVATVRELLEGEGSIGVIAPDVLVPSVTEALVAAGLHPGEVEADEHHRVAVLPASLVKGLEYDAVVLLEPAAIVAQEPARLDGLRRLYVSLTRAVSRMTVLHDSPLPSELART